MNGNLPRGLLSRDGNPVQTSARLPSLRGDPLRARTDASPPVIPSRLLNHLHLSSGSKSKTRGGAQKRQFKPTVPVSKDSSQPCIESVATSPAKKTRKQDPSPRQPRKTQSNRDKRYVQLESSVFTGSAPGSLSVKKNTSYTRGSSGSSSSVTKVKTTLTSSSPVKRDKYLLDDFVVESSEEEEESGDEDKKRSRRFKAKPIGWDTLFSRNKQQEKKKIKTEEKPNCLPSVSSLLKEGSKILVQLPPQLVPRLEDNEETSKLALQAIEEKNGFLGKLRVYESGRVELVCQEEEGNNSMEEDSLYELTRSEEVVTMITVKHEDGTETLVPVLPQMPSTCSRQEVVSFDLTEKEAVSLGDLDPQYKLVLVPQINLETL